jgi:predicted GNAT family acetyltransferase
MEIQHDIKERKVFTIKDGLEAHVEYVLKDGTLDIVHTYVPKELEGQGIASAIVKYTYDFALKQGLKPSATCSYAATWLARHPDYNT